MVIQEKEKRNFLFESIESNEIFTPEDFSEEHQMIAD